MRKLALALTLLVLVITVLQTPVNAPSEHRLADTENNLSNMSAPELIGQLLLTGFPGTDASAAGELMKSVPVSGFILMPRNIDSAPQVNNLLNELKAANPSQIPLFLAIDHEGGRVNRLPSPVTQWPSAAQMGLSPDLLKSVGQAMATELSSLGFNLNFAPVLDINTNSANPVIGERAFGTRAPSVIAATLPYLEGLNGGDIIAAGKHFPGHGDTINDSHNSLPRVEASWPLLADRELLPFGAAVEAGVDVIMTAHVLYPALSNEPATISAEILTGLLRQELGFEGVIITDDLEMRALEHQSIEKNALDALLAGADILLICHSPAKTLRVHSYLLDAMERGELPKARVEEAVTRILALKAGRKIKDTPRTWTDPDWTAHQRLSERLKTP